MSADYQRALIAEIREHGGPVSGPMAGRTLLILTTTGAQSGEPRTAVMTYTQDDGRYLIAASKGGAPTNPAWFHNLVAHPEATAETGGETFHVRATVAGADRDRLWERHLAAHPEFAEYPTKTDRVIPMVVLERID